MSQQRGVRKRGWGLVALCVLAVLAGVLAAGAVLVDLEQLSFQPVLSGSMRPGIEPGDLAVLRPVPARQLRVGEVIAYLPPRRTTPVLHRIVSVTAAGIVTKGDANSVVDPWGRVRPQSAAVTRLVAIVPKLGFLGDVRRQLLIGAGVALVVALVIGRWPRSRTADRSHTAARSRTADEQAAGADSAGSPPTAQQHTQSKGGMLV